MCRQRSGKKWISWFQKQSSHRIVLTTTSSQCAATAILYNMSLIRMKIVDMVKKSLLEEVPIKNFKKPVFLPPESGRVSAAAALCSAGAFLHLQLLSFFITHSSFFTLIIVIITNHHHITIIIITCIWNFFPFQSFPVFDTIKGSYIDYVIAEGARGCLSKRAMCGGGWSLVGRIMNKITQIC